MQEFLKILKKCSVYLNKQELKTLRGQALKGDVVGAEKGLNKLMRCKIGNNL